MGSTEGGREGEGWGGGEGEVGERDGAGRGRGSGEDDDDDDHDEALEDEPQGALRLAANPILILLALMLGGLALIVLLVLLAR